MCRLFSTGTPQNAPLEMVIGEDGDVINITPAAHTHRVIIMLRGGGGGGGSICH